MTNEYIKNTFLMKNGVPNSKILNKHNITSEQLYLIHNKIGTPMCNECNIKENIYRSFTVGYSQFCSALCSNRNNEKKKKNKQTKLERYGDENYNNTEKREITNIARYGSSSPLGNSDIIKKIKNNRIENNHIMNYNNMNRIFWHENFIANKVFDAKKAMIHHNICFSQAHKLKHQLGFIDCRKHNTFAEDEISIHILSDTTENSRNIIKPYELDIYSKEHNFAVEYNGLIWHSSGFTYPNQNKDKNYHLMKTELCEDKGIQLFHIFENEWLDDTKKSIWVSILNGKQNKHQKLGARKCSIKEVSSVDAKIFLEENHLQGSVNGSIRIALMHNNEIVSLMIFGKSRMSKKYEYELLRFCTKKNLTVQGAGSRLLGYFENKYKPKSLISYANRRWSQGNFYEKVGFTFSHDSSPNMFWFKSGSMRLESRLKFQKHKLKDIEGFSFDESKTAKENMYLNDYRVIYDSGNKIYVKDYGFLPDK